MRFIPSAVIVCTLASVSSAYASGADVQTSTRLFAQPAESLRLARTIAWSEADLRGSALAAGVLISSYAGEAGIDVLAVAPEQRDAVVTVLNKYNYLEHLAQLYASLLTTADLQAIAELYADARIKSLQQFQSAAVAAILSLGVGAEVQLPEAAATAASGAETPERDGIAQLVATWFEGIEAQLDVDALIDGIRSRTTAAAIADVRAMGVNPAIATLREAQSNARFGSFDRKEMESPRLRNALFHAVLRIR